MRKLIAGVALFCFVAFAVEAGSTAQDNYLRDLPPNTGLLPDLGIPEASGNQLPAPPANGGVPQIPPSIDFGAMQPIVPQPGVDGSQSDLPIGSALSQNVSEPLPLAEEHRAWYRTYPWLWIPLDGWTNSVEFGLNGSSGNSETTSLQAGADLLRTSDVYTFSTKLNYQKTQAGGAETQNNGRLDSTLDRLLGDTPWSAFVNTGLEYDEFKAFDLRFNINTGLGFYWLKNDTTTLVTRFGAGTSREFGGPDDSWVPEAMFGYEASHQLTPRQKIKGKLDYFPQWDSFSDFRLVSDVAWEILLDGTDNLSLKLSATNRHDSTPQGLEPNDLFYGALLLWKF